MQYLLNGDIFRNDFSFIHLLFPDPSFVCLYFLFHFLQVSWPALFSSLSFSLVLFFHLPAFLHCILDKILTCKYNFYVDLQHNNRINTSMFASRTNIKLTYLTIQFLYCPMLASIKIFSNLYRFWQTQVHSSIYLVYLTQKPNSFISSLQSFCYS